MKKLFLIINLKTLCVCILSLVSTTLCLHYKIYADFPFTIITTAVIFPIVFSIGGAYKRRENALDDYGVMKAHGRALYFASRDWLENTSPELQSRLKNILNDFFTSSRHTFLNPKKDMRKNEVEVYKAFSNLSKFIKVDLRQNGLASGECSRCNQYLSKMIVSYEQIKHIYQYRTPQTLRAFSDFFIWVLPFVYGPYFAHLSQEITHGLEYVMPVLFSVVLVALDNIQSHLENPFDQIGEDDIYINAENFVKRLDLE